MKTDTEEFCKHLESVNQRLEPYVGGEYPTILLEAAKRLRDLQAKVDQMPSDRPSDHLVMPSYSPEREKAIAEAIKGYLGNRQALVLEIGDLNTYRPNYQEHMRLVVEEIDKIDVLVAAILNPPRPEGAV